MENFGNSKRKNRANSESLDAYFLEAGKYKELTRQEEQEIAKRIKEGDEEARQIMAQSNLRFVIDVANKYKGYGLPFSELIAEGNVGLMRAIDLYDADRGTKFITYGVWWIRQAISKYVRTNMNKDYHELANEDFDYEQGFFNEDGEEMIGRKQLSNRDVIAEEEEVKKEVVGEIMSNLTDVEKEVIKCYFGFDCDEMNLEEIGKKVNLTKERVRQIKEMALKKLRSYMVVHPECSRLAGGRNYR